MNPMRTDRPPVEVLAENRGYASTDRRGTHYVFGKLFSSTSLATNNLSKYVAGLFRFWFRNAASHLLTFSLKDASLPMPSRCQILKELVPFTTQLCKLSLGVDDLQLLIPSFDTTVGQFRSVETLAISTNHKPNTLKPSDHT
ncbi:hypothetical protein Hypma_006155, partial [Hypsizygus marmoreus]